MTMQVLLIAEVKDLGSEGDVVQVAEGYARNYLLPRKLAAPVTDASRRQIGRLRADREARLAAGLNAARELAARLSSVSVTIPVKTGGDKLYGSVGQADIVKALKDQGLELDRHAVELEHPLKELGVFDVKVRVHPEVEASVKVWVVEE